MRRRFFFNALWGLLLWSAPGAFGEAPLPSETLHYDIQARLLVEDRESAGEALREWAEDREGYLLFQNLDETVLRLPAGETAALRRYLEEAGEELVRYDQSARDLREEIGRHRSALEAREEVLAKNLAYLSSSDMEGTLALEQEIRRLMDEIDGYRGWLRRLENDRRYARVSVLLSFRSREIPDSRPSRFAWINNLDLYRLMEEDFSEDRKGFGGPRLSPPEGFALVDAAPVFRALSPEGVRLKVWKTDNYPEKEASFWEDALFAQLEGRGYLPMGGPAPLAVGGQEFTVRTWGALYGREDFLYLTGLRLRRGKIEVLEIAGPASYVKDYF